MWECFMTLSTSMTSLLTWPSPPRCITPWTRTENPTNCYKSNPCNKKLLKLFSEDFEGYPLVETYCKLIDIFQGLTYIFLFGDNGVRYPLFRSMRHWARSGASYRATVWANEAMDWKKKGYKPTCANAHPTNLPNRRHNLVASVLGFCIISHYAFLVHGFESPLRHTCM